MKKIIETVMGSALVLAIVGFVVWLWLRFKGNKELRKATHNAILLPPDRAELEDKIRATEHRDKEELLKRWKERFGCKE